MQKQIIKAGIIGGAGYTGGELIRILINHPYVDLIFVNSKSNAGNKLSKIHQDLLGETELLFSEEINSDIDVLFLCVGHGDARKYLTSNNISDHIRIIDLSQDFRLNCQNNIGSKDFIYGLPELNKKEITHAKNIANPGCFATALQLGLLPLAKEKLLKDIYSVGITGSTGAGQSLSETSHFSWRTNNIQAYKSLQHQHIKEVHQSLSSLQKDSVPEIKFVPWRGDFAKGIFITSQLKCEATLEDVIKYYKAFYEAHPFVHISDVPISMKQVINTNKCAIQLEKEGNDLVVHSTIDNLIKGASGQAVQNMNIMFGLNETEGLRLKATGF